MLAHVLLVEIDGDEAHLTPVSGLRADGTAHLMTALTPDNEIRYPPFRVRAVRTVPDGPRRAGRR